ncbi:MAG TPA: hypothetical protein DET40_01360 [Lentisphaeria bacterium]|nr:MAG: hypothetical protein A2X45_09390 [Lentisphaerae bacterium GWF2_50_93]HCE42180.1 hypothetical protein [Lentisphaeria bacterium]
MKKTITGIFSLIAFISVSAQDNDKLAELEKRVLELEKRIAVIESSSIRQSVETIAGQKAKEQQLKARQRMQKDLSVYSQEQLREIESLYQIANRNWRSQEAKDSLKQLVAKYGYANRTGCALLYLGQMSQGNEREEYLKMAMDVFSDCYYGDGVQVGAYARYYLAFYYRENGQDDKAKELFKEIKEKYPDAVDHKGRQLSESIN